MPMKSSCAQRPFARYSQLEGPAVSGGDLNERTGGMVRGMKTNTAD